MKHLKLAILSLLSLMTLSTVAVPAYAQSSIETNKNSACASLQEFGGSSCSDGEKGATKVLRAAIDILTYVVGIASVIMIIIAGLKYVTSNGDAGAISGAKNTIIYAIVGLVVVAFAQMIVYFVINKVK